MPSVGIIGGGITGLTAAFYLKRANVHVTLYESADRAGGVIQTTRRDGYLAEHGPNTILETSPGIAALIADLGLEKRRKYSAPSAEARYLVKDHRPVAMPASPFGFFMSPLFSKKARLALLREPFVPRGASGIEESVAQFVVRRLGQEFLDRAIDPLVAGVYAGNPHNLSVPHAFPKLAQLENDYGSLIKGQIFGARNRKKRGDASKDRAPKFSFNEGLQVLTDTLASQLADRLRLRTKIVALEKGDSKWIVSSDSATDAATEHDAIIYAGSAFNLAGLRITAGPTMDLRSLAEIIYPPVASIVLGFRREDVKHPCEGFGMLIPKIEDMHILGTIFSSSLFPNRAPAGHITLTSYIGGERSPDLARLPEDKMIDFVMQDLNTLLGVSGQPTFHHTAVYPRAIPQYNVGYGKYKQLLSDAEQRAPGLFIAGNFRDGPSLSDSILSGSKTAERITAFLKR
jgi:oxygen-dependent protoporphyrinogen oxidase